MSRNILKLSDLSEKEIVNIIKKAGNQKKIFNKNRKLNKKPLANKSVILFFEKPSTRTLISFQAGISMLGGNSIVLSSTDTHLNRGEPIKDIARVMSRYVQMVVIRTYSQKTINEFAKYSQVPVVNALTDEHHPCQVLADIQTWQEYLGSASLKDKTVVWLGDANNVCRSWVEAAMLLKFNFIISSPPDFNFSKKEWTNWKDYPIKYIEDPKIAAKNADLIITDTWISMGFEKTRKSVKNKFKKWQVNSQIMNLAKPKAVFMHCLPAYRELEVSEKVLESKQSLVWEEAENRMWAQNALMEFLLNT